MRRLLLFFCIFFLAGCSASPAEPSRGLVISRVTVEYSHDSASLTREYRSEEDIAGLMAILRSYVPAGDCAIPEYPSFDRVEVAVFCANGSAHTYELCDFRYLRRDGGLWQLLAPGEYPDLPTYLMLHLGDKMPKKAEPAN